MNPGAVGLSHYSLVQVWLVLGTGVSEERISVVGFRALGARLNMIVLVIGDPVAQVTLERYLDKRVSILSSGNITI